MNNLFAQNIVKYRKAKKLTQEELAQKLNISFQAVSKWETGLSLPDISLLPDLAIALGTDINALMGYVFDIKNVTIYEDAYRHDDNYYWGLLPSKMSYKLLEAAPPIRPLRLLDVGCGEGRDSVFFAKNGYQVTAFDISEAGLDKARRLAEQSNVNIHFFKANINDFRLDTEFDIIFSSGLLHYIFPELRNEIIENYQVHTSEGGFNVFNVFVGKPFIAPPPENEPVSCFWKSGELFTYYSDWHLRKAEEMIFNCNSSGIPHQHCINQILAERIV